MSIITHFKNITIIALFLLLIGLIFSFHHQEVMTQQKFAQTMEEQFKEQKCQLAVMRIANKITSINANKINVEIAIKIFIIYSMGLKAAQDNDTRCFLIEQWGDDTLLAYKQGVSDGKKTYTGMF